VIKLILCEGKTDAIFIGYYLERVKEWVYIGKPPNGIPIGANVQADDTRGETVEWYHKDNNFLLICNVGGKDNFKHFCETKIITAIEDANAFCEIAIVTDRDNRTVKSICDTVQNIFHPIVNNIKTGTWKTYCYSNNYHKISIDFLLLVIPTDKEGALETTMLDAISENECDKIVVDKAKIYIEDIENINIKYINKRRDKLKAWLGATWAVQFPENVLAKSKNQIRSVKWEDSEILAQCFCELVKI